MSKLNDWMNIRVPGWSWAGQGWGPAPGWANALVGVKGKGVYWCSAAPAIVDGTFDLSTVRRTEQESRSWHHDDEVLHRDSSSVTIGPGPFEPWADRVLGDLKRLLGGTGYHTGGIVKHPELKPGEVVGQPSISEGNDAPARPYTAASYLRAMAKANLNERYAEYRRACTQSFPAEGYERLHKVFREAHDQAAYGKGNERHANDLPFHDQRMQTISRSLNSPVGMAYQVEKKLEEGLGMKDPAARRRELLGAINYLAGIVIFLDDQEAEKPGGEV